MEVTKSICAITAEIGALGKNKKNEQQGYAFRGVDDLMNALHPLFAKYGVFLMPEVTNTQRDERITAKGTALISVTVTVRYHFVAMDGSEIVATVVGEGMDSADKATNKAMTAAFKNVCFQTFCIPTDEVTKSDPDRETPDASISAERVIQERLIKCKSVKELAEIANQYSGTIRNNSRLWHLYQAQKTNFTGGKKS